MNQPDEINSEFERRLQEQYREAARETPPAALDKRILDAARAAAAESAAARPNGPDARGNGEPAMGKFSSADFPVNDMPFSADRDDAPRARREEFRWGRPLALAAAVVLGIGIVTRVQMERPDLTPPSDSEVAAKLPKPAEAPAQPSAPAPAVAQAPAASTPAPAAEPPAAVAPAAPAPVASGTAVASADTVGKAKDARAEDKRTQERDMVRAEAREKKADTRGAPEVAAAPGGGPVRARVPGAFRDELAKEEAAAKMRESAANELKRMESAQVAQGGMASGNVLASGDAAGATSRRMAEAAKPAEPPRPAAAAAPATPSAAAVAAAPQTPAMAAAPPAPPPPPAAAPAPAPQRAQAAAGATAGVRGTEFAGDAQPVYESDPDLWAARIADMRRGGRVAQADAELKRLRARYPAYKVPAAAMPPAP